jgi:hypothetical protein
MSQDSIASLQAEVSRLQSELSAVHQEEGELIFVGQYLIVLQYVEIVALPLYMLIILCSKYLVYQATSTLDSS